jgi:hypothetical protein
MIETPRLIHAGRSGLLEKLITFTQDAPKVYSLVFLANGLAFGVWLIPIIHLYDTVQYAKVSLLTCSAALRKSGGADIVLFFVQGP